MNCILCGNDDWLKTDFIFDKPDKYESWMGITDIYRQWLRCQCGLYKSFRNYPLSELQKIYTEGYRDPKFRGETIRESFDKVMALPPSRSENAARFKWFIHHISKKTACNVLDIGSGLGVWPYVLKMSGYDVWCVETNKESIEFISKTLGIKCVEDLPTYAKFDIITCIHVLEHIEYPQDFLNNISKMLKSDGELFIETPDATEFTYLPKEHNEFSSDHVYFYDLSTLNRLVDSCGFEIVHAYRPYYKERQLSRVLTIARLKK